MVSRQHIHIGLHPLPRRAFPQPWEDLASLISRTARVMHYTDPIWVLQPEALGYGVAPDDLPVLRKHEDYHVLTQLLALSEEQILSLTLSRFNSRLSSSSAEGRQKQRGLGDPRFATTHQILFSQRGRTTRLCPACLDEEGGYDRLYWRVRPVLLCPRHRIFLCQDCPSCHAPIPALRSHMTLCPRCRTADYRSMMMPLPDDAMWLYDSHLFFLQALGVDGSECGESERKEPSVSKLSRASYFHFVEQFLHFFENASARVQADFFSRLFPLTKQAGSADQMLVQLLHYVLSDWPIHFWIMLERFHEALQGDIPRHEALDTLAEHWNAQFQQRSLWLQEVSEKQLTSQVYPLLDLASRYFFVREDTGKKGTPFGQALLPEEPVFVQTLRSCSPQVSVLPFPWEDITSVINRVSSEQRYAHPRWMLVTAGKPHDLVSASDLPLLHRLDDYQVLQRQLGLEQDTLHALTLHRFAHVLQKPEVIEQAATSYTPGQIIHQELLTPYNACLYFQKLTHTRVCPRCLDETPRYDRLYWRFDAALICPRHGHLLLDHCPQCHAPIPSFRPLLTLCPSCRHGDYRHVSFPLLSATAWLPLAQSLMFHFLGLESVSIPTLYNGSPLLLLLPWQYFDLFRQFHLLLLKQSSESLLLHALSRLECLPEETLDGSRSLFPMALHLSLFHYLFTHWPTHFLSFLEHLVPLLVPCQERGGLIDLPQDGNELIAWFGIEKSSYDDTYLFLKHLLQRCASLDLWPGTGHAVFPPLYWPTKMASMNQVRNRVGKGDFLVWE